MGRLRTGPTRTATGEPTTSNINFTTPGAVVPNSDIRLTILTSQGWGP